MSAATVEEGKASGLLVPGTASPSCRACVTIPVRNEEATLAACLDALAGQVTLDGEPFPMDGFEVLLLCNNCTDGTLRVAQSWREMHPEMRLHLVEREFAEAEAHAGTARRLLMETAWQRLQGSAGRGSRTILCTDADSRVAPDWLAQNLEAVEQGADAVGGLIALCSEEAGALPERVRQCYQRDRRYAALIAELEDLLDPQAGDPWPRHLDHFGSSLACTTEAYARAGGMPAAAVLEDEAFVNRLRQADLRLRHAPAVRVYTSARLDGRATTGLAGQLRQWSALPDAEAHRVQSSGYLRHRFCVLRHLREAFRSGTTEALPAGWRRRIEAALREAATIPTFLQAVDCDRLIAETYTGALEEPIGTAMAALMRMIATERRAAGETVRLQPAGPGVFPTDLEAVP